MKNIVVVGGGIAGVETACLLAESGNHVTIIERSDKLGGKLISTSAYLSSTIVKELMGQSSLFSMPIGHCSLSSSIYSFRATAAES